MRDCGVEIFSLSLTQFLMHGKKNGNFHFSYEDQYFQISFYIGVRRRYIGKNYPILCS